MMMEQINTFWKIIQKIGIEIPPIQRDYAQGRATVKAEKVRKSFLESIFMALENNESLSLDFVYGKIYGLRNEEEHRRNKQAIQSLINSVKDYALTIDLKLDNTIIEDKSKNRSDLVYLIPLDGQQRLTTLFLIHWYIAKRLGKVDELFILNRFRYKTRKSSTAFLNLLTGVDTKLRFTVEVNIKENLKEGSFYEELKGLEFFSLSWLNDPTVQAMLNMLQVIHYHLQHTDAEKLENYWKGLTDKDLLHFDFLDLKDFNLSDDLYVKMNARGKQLTSFENFKAWLFGEIEDKKLIQPNIWNDYKNKFDIEWNDIFWNHKREDIFNIDDAYFNYFKKRYLVDLTINAKIQNNAFSLKSDKNISENILNCNEDFDFENIFSRRFKYRVNGYLNSLQNFSIHDSIVLEEFTTFKEFWFNNTEKFTWIDLIRNYVFISFFEYNADKLKKSDFNFFNDYYRVISNLINNQTFDNTQLYQNALREITVINRYMNRTDENIYGWLNKINADYKTVFTKDQIEEEKLKYKLIEEDGEWLPNLIKAEKHILFKGKIYFLLNLAKNNRIDFIKYYEKIAPLFETEMLSNPERPVQRSLLTFGNYFEKKSEDTFYFYKNDSSTYRSRRENWLGFLNNQNEGGILHQLISDPLYKESNPLTSLNDIVNRFMTNHSLESFIKLPLAHLEFYKFYIYCSQLFDYGESKLIKLSANKFGYQLNKSNTGGYFNDIILEFIKFNYFNDNDSFKIYRTKGWDNSPSIEIENHRIRLVPSQNKIINELIENTDEYESFDTIFDTLTNMNTF